MENNQINGGKSAVTVIRWSKIWCKYKSSDFDCLNVHSTRYKEHNHKEF